MNQPKPPEPIFDSEEEHADFAFQDSDEWIEVEMSAERRAELRQAARQMLAGQPRKRISIAIPERDLARLKTRAAEKGMPYQTLISSILHEYVEG